ncbi:hypothetical protein [Roseibium sp. M-1]
MRSTSLLPREEAQRFDWSGLGKRGGGLPGSLARPAVTKAVFKHEFYIQVKNSGKWISMVSG